jgi:exopolysaccharide biosynthesis operon protein EpsL
MISCRKFLLLGLFATFLSHATQVLADDDVFNIDAALNVMRDNNLFRLAPSVDPQTLGLSGKSDTITTTTVGVDFKKPLEQQQFLGNISVVNSRYQENKYLDFTALNYDGKWLWALGPRWAGELAVDRAESLNSFTDYSNFGVRNKRTNQNESFTLSYWYHSDWAVLAGVTRNQLTNEQTFLADSDYTAKGYNVGLRYRPRSGNSVTLRAKHSTAEYTNRPFDPILQFDNGFSQTGYEALLDWQIGAKSKLKGRLEHINRQHDHFSSRDYSGVVGDFNFVFMHGADITTSAGYKHTIESFQQATLTENSSYYISDEPNVSLQWAASNKITATVRFGVGRRTYHGEIAALPPGIPQREDKFSRGSLDVSYKPLRSIELKAGLTQENRNVNSDALDYKDRTVFISGTIRF